MTRQSLISAEREMVQVFNSTMREKELCVICVIHEGVWRESVCMIHESQRRGMSLSVCGMATFLIDNLLKLAFKYH